MYRRRYWNEAIFDAVDALGAYFDPRGKSLTHVSLAWVLAQPAVTSAIVGASKPEQLEDSLGALGVTLDEAELEACDGAWFSLPRSRTRIRRPLGADLADTSAGRPRRTVMRGRRGPG